jgi:hypothetical protein
MRRAVALVPMRGKIGDVNPFDGISVTLRIPDLWQQEAVRALDAGRDVVVHAPTGAGKTYIFELLVERGWRKRAVFTVPTRALANDKLAEWRARGWNVGIATGDVAENLDAPVVVATLETQKSRFLARTGPDLLVIDEYQLLADPMRGMNYELAVALAPPGTQILMLSGSVGNPDDVAGWLRRLGRDAVLVHHPERPVPLEEIMLEALPERIPGSVRGFWPRLVARALQANLGPVLVFAPQRNAAEKMARHLAAALPVLDPLSLSRAQEVLAGDRLARLLKARVAFHHSGLSYAQRAGLVEPLAKAGQLRAVVATTGLAAGINFSTRSVLVTETEYTANNLQRLIRPDELLQMFGRAGRRGLDEIGYVLVAPERPRLAEARPLHVRRASPVEWPGLLAVMRSAAGANEDPFRAAVALSARLFSPQTVPLGVEHCLATGPMPCGIAIDAPRARHARPLVVEMLNSRELWEPRPTPSAVPLGDVLVRVHERWRPALSLASVVARHGSGQLCLLGRGREKRYGREVPIAARDRGDAARLVLFKPVRRMLDTPAAAMPDGAGRHSAPRSPRWLDDAGLRTLVVPRVAEASGGGEVVELVERQGVVSARIDFSRVQVEAVRDSLGAALLDPPVRKAYPAECQVCAQLAVCENELSLQRSPALAWLQLGLIDAAGLPTRRGGLFSFFHNGEGLAVAAALEDDSYDIDALLHDLANLRSGHRFGEHAGASGRLGVTCRTIYGEVDFEGYLERGLPVQYGEGAAEVLAEVAGNRARPDLFTEELRPGDVERARLEWHSLLRHIAKAPDLDWTRWRLLRAAAAGFMENQPGRVLFGDLPPLSPAQTRRIDHRLRFG